MMVHRTDVLVVGGGPAGSVAAFQLAKAGLDVLLIDRARFPRDKTCGESLSPGAIARLEAIGMWRDSATRLAQADAPPHTSQAIHGMKVSSPSGTEFLGTYRKDAHGAGLAIKRSRFDHELLEASRGAGARILEEVEATHADDPTTDDAVVHARATAAQARLRITAKRVIVADGRRSFLARQLGFLETAPPAHSGRRYAVRAHCSRVFGLSSLAEMHVGAGGYCGIAPLSPTTANVCYVLFTDRLHMSRSTMEADFHRDLRLFPHIVDRLRSIQFDGSVRVVGPLQLKSRRQTHGRFIACGDTTGFLDPFTGEGIAHAIASGTLGAEAIRRSFTGDELSLASYERQIRQLRRVKGVAASLLYGLVAHPRLANTAASVFARWPRMADTAVQLFGDQV